MVSLGLCGTCFDLDTGCIYVLTKNIGIENTTKMSILINENSWYMVKRKVY